MLEDRCADFAKKIEIEKLKTQPLFPKNKTSSHIIRKKENFLVNFALLAEETEPSISAEIYMIISAEIYMIISANLYQYGEL